MAFCQTVFDSEKRLVVNSAAIMSRDFYDPTPEEQVVVFVASETLRRPES
jgi:hypothetical protein